MLTRKSTAHISSCHCCKRSINSMPLRTVVMFMPPVVRSRSPSRISSSVTVPLLVCVAQLVENRWADTLVGTGHVGVVGAASHQEALALVPAVRSHGLLALLL